MQHQRRPGEGRELTRRELLVGGLRLLALGGLGVLGAKLLFRSRASAGSGDPGLQSCVSDGVCRACSTLEGCGLPQALSYRDRSGGRT